MLLPFDIIALTEYGSSEVVMPKTSPSYANSAQGSSPELKRAPSCGGEADILLDFMQEAKDAHNWNLEETEAKKAACLDRLNRYQIDRHKQIIQDVFRATEASDPAADVVCCHHDPVHPAGSRISAQSIIRIATAAIDF